MKTLHRSLLGAALVLTAGAVVLIEVPRSHAGDAPTTAPAPMAGMDMAAPPTTGPVASSTTQPSTKPAVAENKHCPISGDAVDPTVTVVYKGKTYAFCCADCVKTFNKDPQKYIDKMAMADK